MSASTFRSFQWPNQLLYTAYHADLVRRRNPADGTSVVSLSATYPDSQVVAGDDIQWLIDDRRGPTTRIQRNSPGVTPRAEVTVDLGAEYTLGRWRQNCQNASGLVHVDFEGSTDGNTWTEIESAVNSGSGIVAPLHATKARYIRAKYEITEGDALWIGPLFVYPSVLGEAVIVEEGFDGGYLTSASIIDKSPNGWESTPTSNAAWYYGSPNFYRGIESGATGDAQITKDLGQVLPVVAIPLVMGFPEDQWQFGIAVECRSSTSESWETLYDTSSPFAGTTLTFSGGKPMRYVRITNKRGERSPGVFGTGRGRLCHFGMHVGDPDAERPAPLGYVNVPVAGWLTTGISDSNGTLHAMPYKALPVQPGTYAINWDGLGFDDQPVAAEALTVRAALSELSANLITAAGNTGAPGDQPNPDGKLLTNARSIPGTASALAFDPDGNLYWGGIRTEDTARLAKIAPDGKIIFNGATVPTTGGVQNETYGMAANSTHYWRVWRDYNSQGASWINLSRHDGADGAIQATLKIVDNYTTPIPDGRTRRTDRELWLSRACHGLAANADGSTLFVANMRESRIMAFDGSGATITEYPTGGLDEITEPVGIVMDPSGSDHVWISYNGDRIGKFSFNPTTREINPMPVVEITGLDFPTYLAARVIDETPYLYAVEMGRDAIRQWDISGATPTPDGPFEDFTHPYVPGDFDPMALKDIRAIAVAENGSIWVGVGVAHKTIHIGTDGSLLHFCRRGFGPCARVLRHTITDESIQVATSDLDLEIKIDGNAFTKQEGGLGPDLKWRITRNWEPLEGEFYHSRQNYGESNVVVLDTPAGPREFLFHNTHIMTPNPEAIVIYAHEPQGIRRCAALGLNWSGLDADQPKTNTGWSWRDTDGDGVIEEGELVEELSSRPAEGSNSGWCVDSEGTIYFSTAFTALWTNGQPPDPSGRAMVRIPLAGWEDLGDGRYNPIYEWKFVPGQTIVWPHSSLTDPYGQIVAFARPMREPNKSGFVGTVRKQFIGPYGEKIRVGIGKIYNYGALAYWYLGFDLPDGATQQVDPDPLNRPIVWEHFSSGESFWTYPRDTSNGMILGMVLIDDDALGIPGTIGWIDNHHGHDVIATPNGRTLLVQEGNWQANVYVTEVQGLNTIRQRSATLAWPGEELWDGEGAVTIELPLEPDPPIQPPPNPPPGPKPRGRFTVSPVRCRLL